MMTAIGDHVKLAERHGAVLAGRAEAISLRESLAHELAENGVVVLDFAGVETVSPSFADELFGRFVDSVGEDRVRFENLNAHLLAIASMIRRDRSDS
jgi:hypothetical protein